MDKPELLNVLEAAKKRRAATLAQRIEAGARGEKTLLAEYDQKIAECDEIIADIQRVLDSPHK